jgi:hypothetical protein
MLGKTIEDDSDLVVEHRFYRGSRSPYRFVCSRISELEVYLRDNARPGDSFVFWRFDDCCRDENIDAQAKFPDADGRVPLGGSY